MALKDDQSRIIVLFLLRFGVPFWALAFVFGHNAMWWYRLYLCLERSSIVGTTVHQVKQLPTDLLADEHHIRIQGQRAYVVTTIGYGCLLGAEACAGADEESLKKGYAIFKQEAMNLDADYQPDTVKTDGCWATQNAWSSLFPKVFIYEFSGFCTTIQFFALLSGR